MGLSLGAWVKKTVDREETQLLSGKEKVLGTAVSKEGHADNLLEHDRTHHNWFSKKRCNFKQCFLLPTPSAKFTLRSL